MPKKILWISYCVPYDTVAHAGGKIENYYIKGINNQKEFDVRLISFAREDDLPKIDLDEYGIKYKLILHHESGLLHLWWGMWNRIRKWNFRNKYAGFVSPYVENSLKRSLSELRAEGYNPDVIVLQWTQIVLMMKYIQKIFPGIPIVAVEEDVSYLGSKRKFEMEKKFVKKWFKKQLYNSLKTVELECLNKASLVVLNNFKDKNLLASDGLSKNTWMWCPYFQSYIDLPYIGKNKDVIFYGAMNREENWKSAIWFIENVFSSINDENIKLYIVGNRPNSELMKYKSERVIITGFVEDVAPYLQNAMCLVAPLLFGAGVKIKVIEAMSAGVPVLTNAVGIEGIKAENGVHYFHCENAAEYLSALNMLINNEVDIQEISDREKSLVIANYNYEESLKEFSDKLKLL